ncbi:phosphoesterase RecJ-like protein [Haloferula luteola]|uniref:Phosphoesterase RecJ-like protein n=1 Tax=Haloferula luteola TaxID=595692 RepID=A0A840V0M4_9BACT|nr:bifunctional oligoribonuclease/PAP phosphatase NrnA [Haloferula luteola]MBB5350616.1 phosphoesterase RecJ-like protein [Haloferula luteola]
MSKTPVIAEIGQWLNDSESFALLSHVRPDGDAIGSQIALGFALMAAGKTVRLINEDGLPENLAFMAGSEKIERPSGEPVEVDVVIALDTATQPRLGERTLAAVANCRRWINIDHHKSNPGYGDLNLIDSSSPATGQILYSLIRELGLPMPAESRDAIYVAVSTDTGSWQYRGTTAETYEMAADLVRGGTEVGPLNALIYDNHPMRRVELMRALLNTLEVSSAGRLAHWKLDQATVSRLGVKPEDSEGLIDIIRAIQGVIVAVFFEELPDGKIRVSMRSKDPRVDACKVCMLFGGGGHSLAAGIRMSGPLADAQSRVIEAIEAELATLND